MLGLPLTAYIGPAEGIKLKPEVCWICGVKITKYFAPPGFIVELVRIVYGMAGFVAQQSHQIALIVGGITHLPFDPYEPVVREVKGDTHNRNAVRTTPLIAGAGEIVGGLEKELLAFKLSIKFLNAAE